jgi:hypothetical protein
MNYPSFINIYAVEGGSDAVMYNPSFINIRSGIPNRLGRGAFICRP